MQSTTKTSSNNNILHNNYHNHNHNHNFCIINNYTQGLNDLLSAGNLSTARSLSYREAVNSCDSLCSSISTTSCPLEYNPLRHFELASSQLTSSDSAASTASTSSSALALNSGSGQSTPADDAADLHNSASSNPDSSPAPHHQFVGDFLSASSPTLIHQENFKTHLPPSAKSSNAIHMSYRSDASPTAPVSIRSVYRSNSPLSDTERKVRPKIDITYLSDILVVLKGVKSLCGMLQSDLQIVFAEESSTFHVGDGKESERAKTPRSPIPSPRMRRSDFGVMQRVQSMMDGLKRLTKMVKLYETECTTTSPYGHLIRERKFRNRSESNPQHTPESDSMVVYDKPRSLSFQTDEPFFPHATSSNTNLKKVKHLWCINTKIASQLDLDDSIARIISGVCDILNCERATLFFIDYERKELVSKFTSNQVTREIRFPMSQGIAGYVATTGQTLDIPDAYKDKRFNRSVDKESGFITRSILCMAIKNPSGKPLAVIEAINKKDNEEFNAEDLAMLGILATQVGIVLNNAQKFEQAVDTQKQITLMINAAKALSSKLQLDPLCYEIVTQAKVISGADLCYLGMVTDVENEFVRYGTGQKVLSTIDLEPLAIEVHKSNKILKVHGKLPEEAKLERKFEDDNESFFDIINAIATEEYFKNKEKPETTQFEESDYELISLPISDSSQKTLAILTLVYCREAATLTSSQYTQSLNTLLLNFTAQTAVAIENSQLFEKSVKWHADMQSMMAYFKGAIFTIGEDEKLITSNRPYDKFCIDEDLMKNGSYKKWLQPLEPAGSNVNNDKLIEDIERVLKFKYPVYCCGYLFIHPRDPSHKMFIDYNIFPMADVSDKTSVVLVFKESPHILSPKGPNIPEENVRRRSSIPLDRTQLKDTSSRSRSLEKVTILFSDICGFTSMTEAMALEDIVDMLNAYFTEMVDAVFEEHGTLDKYIGDGMLCVFGLTPNQIELPKNVDSINACNAALGMRNRLAKFNENRTEETKISIGVGISTGRVSVGSIGSMQHFEFTVIGDDVNLACRLEGCTRIYGVRNMILCSDSTYQEAAENFIFRQIDTVCVKGKTKPIKIYELLGRNPEEVEKLVPGLTKALSSFNNALTLFQKKQWKESQVAFESVLKLSDDNVSRHYIDRCSQYIINPPPDDWDGVRRLLEK